MHLTVNSLNSLAEILREAKPLYAKCQSIINDLANGEEKSQVASYATEQARLPGTRRGSQAGNENRLYASRVKDRPQPDPNGLESGDPESEANGSKPDPDLTEADPVTESRTTVRKAETSGHTSSFNGSRCVEGGAKHSELAQPKDGPGNKTTGADQEDKVAAAHRPEPVPPSQQGMNSAEIPAFEEPPQVSCLLMARYNREELYEKVLTLAMHKVAKEYGVSDSTLSRTCKDLYVPVPGVGYWNKMAANQPVRPRPSLPLVQIRSPRRTGSSRAPKPRTIPVFEELPKVSPVLMARHNREDLYKKSWKTETMKAVSKEYGVSDVAIGKVCRKLYIPVPGTGYRNKKAANQPVEPRPPLPVIQPPSEPSEGYSQQAVTKTASAGLPSRPAEAAECDRYRPRSFRRDTACSCTSNSPESSILRKFVICAFVSFISPTFSSLDAA